MKFPRFFTVPALALAVAGQARAIEFNLEASIGGSTIFPETAYGILVADTLNDGFQFLTDTSLLISSTSAAAGSFLGADDLIFVIDLMAEDFDPSNGLYGFNLDNTTFETDDFSLNWGAGDRIGLVWYPTKSSDIGDPFGFYRSNDVQTSVGSTIAFFTPAANATDSLFDLGTGVGGETTNMEYGAVMGTIVAVPEPQTAFLLVLAPIAFCILRAMRRQRA